MQTAATHPALVAASAALAFLLASLPTEGSCPRASPHEGDLSFTAPVCRPWSQLRLGQRVAGDLDEDGRADLVTTDHNDPGGLLQAWRSLGDGRFALFPFITRPPSGPRGWELYTRETFVADLDADGHLDIAVHGTREDTAFPGPGERPAFHALDIAYGTGGGGFERWRSVALSAGRRSGSVLLADADGDGLADLIHTRAPLGSFGQSHYRVLLSRGRSYEEVAGFEIGADRADLMRVGDLDGDDLADLLYAIDVDPEPYRQAHRLFLRRAIGGGAYGPEEEIEGWGEPLELREVTIADLDEDGLADLYLQLARAGLDRPNLTFRGDGTGRFETIRRGPSGPPPAGLFRLVDLDVDGRPDLVETVPRSDPDRRFLVRRGHGTGTFGPAEGPWQQGAGEEDPVADFTGDGVPDVLGFSGSYGRYVACFSRGEALRFDVDARPLDLSLLLYPEITNLAGPAEVPDRTWRVAALAVDDCVRARARSRRIDLPELPEPPAVHFVREVAEAVEIYENPATGLRQVLLSGPDESSSRAAFDAARRRGGYLLRNGHSLRIESLAAYGPPPAAAGLDPGSLRLLRLRLVAGKPESAEWTGPGDVSFTLTGEDDAGNAARATEVFRAARDRYCAGPGAEQLVCP